MGVEGMLSRIKSDVRSLLTTVLLAIILYAFGLVDELLRLLCVRLLTEHFETRFRIKVLSVFLASGKVDFEECSVSNWSCFRQGDALEVSGGSVCVDVVHALLSRRAVVDSASFRRVKIAICRHSDGSLNFEFFAKKKRAAYNLAEEEDDWVEIAKPAVKAEELSETLDEVEEDEVEEDSVVRRWAETFFQRAGEVEGRLRRRQRRSMFEDAALAALDAAKNAKTSLGESTEQAKLWAIDKLRDGLHEALAKAYDRADANIARQHVPNKWKLEFSRGATLSVDEISLDIFGPDGSPLFSRTLVFHQRLLENLDLATQHLSDRRPSRMLLKICFVLAEECVQELVDKRPADAADVAKAIAKVIATDTSTKTKLLIQARAESWLNQADDDDQQYEGIRPNPASLSDLCTPVSDF